MTDVMSKVREAPVKYEQSFSPVPPSAHAARRFVRACLAQHGITSDDSELIVSELVANVVQYAQTTIAVKVAVEPTLRLEVHDGNSIIPAMTGAADDAESGRGLFIIQTLAADWGIQTAPSGKFVWVEVDRENA